MVHGGGKVPTLGSWCVGLFWVAVVGLAVAQGLLLALSLRWGRGRAAERGHVGRTLDVLWTFLPAAFLVALVVLTWPVAFSSC